MRARTTAQGDGSPAPAAGCDAAPPGPYPSGGLAPSAEAYLPEGRVSLPVLRRAVLRCKGCGIYRCGTRAVFGEGPPEVESGRAAAIMLVGEQPGDHEERQGRPFVGPAGKLLDRALVEAGIDRKRVYVTNAVKHFKFTARGKRRMHSKPSARETDACRPWLEREIELVAPRLIVALGATAARSLLGPAFRVTKRRGELITGTRWGAGVIATVHPSSILRAPGDEERRAAFAAFVRDLAAAATHLKSGATSKAGVPAGRAAGGRAAGEPRRAPRRTAGGSRAGAVSDGAAAAPRGAGSAPPVRRPSR